MHRLLRCAVVCLISGHCADAGEVTDVPPLAKVEAFAFGGVGIAGITSKGELAFRKALTSPGAREEFIRVAESGAAAARCYALEGLRLLNQKSFEDAAAPLSRSTEPVETAEGCIISRHTLGEMVKVIRTARYDEQAKMPPREHR